ncbi:MAG: amidohydrolase, partial [Alishewanella sp. 32-51-5]
MKLIKSILAAACVLAAGSAAAVNPVPGTAASQPLLLKNATVHSVVAAPTVQDVLIQDGKIAAVGANLTVPANAQVQDLTGKNLYPGLIALINQLGLIEVEAVRATRDDRETTATNPDLRAEVAFNADSAVIPTIRSNGFSHSLIYPSGALITGRSALMQLDGWNWQDALVQSSVG